MSENKQAYISHVHLKGYKSIRDMEVDLLPGLNIIIGPNGSGKTNFLEFLDTSIHFKAIDSDTYSNIQLVVDSDSLIFIRHYIFLKNQTKRFEQLGLLEEKVYLNTKLVHDLSKKIWKYNDPAFFIGFEFDLEQVQRSVFILMFANTFKFGFYNDLFLVDKPIKFIKTDKYSTSEFYAPYQSINHMIGQYFSIIDSLWVNKIQRKEVKYAFGHIDFITKFLAFYTPIKDVRLSDSFFIDHKKKTIENLFYEFFVNEKWLRWEQLSDGTKRIFLIIAETCSETTIFSLEEPELGIHPDQLKKLMQFLKEQAKDKQIIITTHSPQVLNILSEEELDHIITTRYDAEKGTTMHHLTAEQKQVAHNYIEEGLSLGDAWVYSTQFEHATEEEEIE